MSTIVLIHGQWMTPLSWQGWKERFESRGHVAALDEHLDGRGDGPIFKKRNGQRLDRHAAYRRVARLARAAGIEIAVTPHTLRHTFVTLSLDAGVSPREVQDAAGHRDPRTTQRYDRGRGNLERHPTYQLAAYLSS